ncbi:hypothetical protein EYF80_036506 [Liparis tanakae]|uniref:Uncharacterized protein n=1 Tax=Liparis tanakae TaxID=230148 RepID=A0A4Z2GKQ0_9TELE|nr:hypothetical protein EYF80_036506 [Liparis tanakae]
MSGDDGAEKAGENMKCMGGGEKMAETHGGDRKIAYVIRGLRFQRSIDFRSISVLADTASAALSSLSEHDGFLFGGSGAVVGPTPSATRQQRPLESGEYGGNHCHGQEMETT